MKTTKSKTSWLPVILALSMMMAATSCTKKEVEKGPNPRDSFKQTAWQGTYESSSSSSIIKVAFYTNSEGAFIILKTGPNEHADFTFEHTDNLVKIERTKKESSSALDGSWFIKERTASTLVLENVISPGKTPIRIKLDKTHFTE